MEWPPSWLRIKPPRLKDLSGDSALSSIAYVLLGCLAFTFLSAFFQDKTLLQWMLGIDTALVATFIIAYFYFMIFDADRLGPPSHQRQMAKLLQDERKRLGGTMIDGTLTTNTEKPEPRAVTHG